LNILHVWLGNAYSSP